jgi:DNA primase large subunit
VKKGEGLGGGESVDHPNRWFDRSWELERLARGETTGGKSEEGKMDVDS